MSDDDFYFAITYILFILYNIALIAYFFDSYIFTSKYMIKYKKHRELDNNRQ